MIVAHWEQKRRDDIQAEAKANAEPNNTEEKNPGKENDDDYARERAENRFEQMQKNATWGPLRNVIVWHLL